MMWDLVAIWVIVAVVVVWFVRDEILRRRQIPARRLAASLDMASGFVRPQASGATAEDLARAEAVRRKFVQALMSKVD